MKIGERLKDNYIAIMAGGSGTRLRPLTWFVPKPLISTGTHRFIDYAIESSLSMPASSVGVHTCYKARMVEEYVRKKYKIEFFREPFPLNTGGAIRFNLEKIDHMVPENIIIRTCDHIVDIDYKQALQFHREKTNMITVITSTPHQNDNRLVLENSVPVRYLGKEDRVDESQVSLIGEYIFNWAFLKDNIISRSRGEKFDLGWSVVKPIVDEGKYKVGIFETRNWLDLGRWSNLIGFVLQNEIHR